ncbi:hypothetical protein THF5G08_140072 [Vibrio jasicida]|nr:hypothetical protein THF5G08_140072 [Vibrio jasicida]
MALILEMAKSIGPTNPDILHIGIEHGINNAIMHEHK